MGWTTPLDWTGITNNIVTAAQLNQQVRDNLNVLSTHAHSGAAGMGSATMSGLTLTSLGILTFADQSANPDAAGELQRNGNDILWYGSSAVNLSAADASAGTASLRSLGTTSVKAAAGNHTHEITQEAESTTDKTNTGSATCAEGGTDLVSIAFSGANAANAVYVIGAADLGTISASYNMTATIYAGASAIANTGAITGTGGAAGSERLCFAIALVQLADTSSVTYKIRVTHNQSGVNVRAWAALSIREVTIL
jgi:hypothetical protein